MTKQDYDKLRDVIKKAVYPNGVYAITGLDTQSALLQMLGATETEGKEWVAETDNIKRTQEIDEQKITINSQRITVNDEKIATNERGIATNTADITKLKNDKQNKADAVGKKTAEGGEIFNDTGNNKAGDTSHAEGDRTKAMGLVSHAEGSQTIASGIYAHAEGNGTTASGKAAHAEGTSCRATNNDCHAEGNGTLADGTQCHAEGSSTTASVNSSHAEGASTKALADYAHAEGLRTSVSGTASHGEGRDCVVSASYSHAEGQSTTASGIASHAEGEGSLAQGQSSHAEGKNTKANGIRSHAEGAGSIATGNFSHAGCVETEAYNFGSTSIGCFNAPQKGDTSNYVASNDLFEIGNGTSAEARGNAFTVTGQGNVRADGTYTSPAGDYAEMFEWKDGNKKGEDRVGYIVAIDGEKIVKANGNEHIGIVSAKPSILGDNPMRWAKKFATDEWGRVILEDVEVKYTENEEIPSEERDAMVEAEFNARMAKAEPIAEEGLTEEEIAMAKEMQKEQIRMEAENAVPYTREVEKTRTDTVQKLNPDYNPELDFIPRTDRSEWSAVGMMGKLLVRQDGTLKVGGKCSAKDGIATNDENGSIYVMKVINEAQALVLVK